MASPRRTPGPQSSQSELPYTPSRKEPYLNALEEFSPLTKTEDSSKEGLTENEAKERHERHGVEVQRNLVGPMPVEFFLEEYLPVAPATMPKTDHAFKGVPTPKANQTDFAEKKINEPLTRALNGRKEPRCPGIVFVNTGDRPENKYGSKPDISAYLEGLGITVADASYQQLFVEIKLKDFASDSPAEGEQFLFDHIKNQDERGKARRGLGQQAFYATEICARQHRNFLFSIFITPTHARFLRWDRAGVVVSASFDFRATDFLCDFLWRFGHMSHAQRGGDTTVKSATEAEEKIFKEAIGAHLRAQLGDGLKGDLLQDAYNRHYEPNIVVKIPVQKRMLVTLVTEAANANQQHGSAVPRLAGQKELVDAVQNVNNEKDREETKPSAKGKGKQKEIKPKPKKAEPKEIVTFDAKAEVEEFLVSRPVASPLSLASRGTRGYWAVHVKNKTVHFLKDAWRTGVEDIQLEGRILEKLALKEVRNVPTVLCWSDVGPVDDMLHCTQTDYWKEVAWNKHRPDDPKTIRLTRRVHYRQVTREAGYILEQLTGTHELLKGAHDVFEALRDAYIKCNRFHRDVSSSNIILYADPKHQYSERRAILVDWELSCEDINSPARDHWISGTWAFMSINALQAIRRKHHACDDIESLIYVIFYCAVHFLQWKKYNLDNHREINGTFFHYCAPNGLTGGIGKENNTINGRYFNAATFEDVSQWLTKSVPLIRKYYGPDTKALAAAVFADYKPIFERKQSYWKTLSKRNREVHKLLYKGPPLDVHRAPTVSSHHTSVILVEDDPPAKSPNEGSSLKRDLASIEQPVFESSSKRQKTDQKEVIAAHPRKGLAKRMKKRLPDKLKH